jgi:hypothetical protein
MESSIVVALGDEVGGRAKSEIGERLAEHLGRLQPHAIKRRDHGVWPTSVVSAG